MTTKLSDALTSLAAKSKSVEDKIAMARQETKEKIDKRIKESKAELQAEKDQFVNHAEAVNAKVKDDLYSFKEAIDHKIDHIKAEAADIKDRVKEKIDKTKHEWDVASAERYYNDSLDYAAACIEWANVALNEVETATLECFAAKLELEDVREKHSATAH
jgi:murein L,D-transpeptidase YafK